MSDAIQFVRNHRDLSTKQGFQFEFFCDRCRSGFRTRFKASVTSTISSVLNTASGVFGGVFGRVARVGRDVRSSSWEQAHDRAFEDAVQEIMPEFAQCPHCSKWVCRKACWNTKRGLCKECAPDLGVEMSAAQADRSVEEIHAHAAMAEEDKQLGEEHWRETIRAACPKCEAPLATNANFCPECGAKLKGAGFCSECGAKLTPGAKFCPECGDRTGD